MGNKSTQYKLIDGTSDEVEDRGFQTKEFFQIYDYSKLVGSGTTYKEALDRLTNKCKYNGV